MGGAFSAGGLITGIDSGNLIRQLMQLERQPIVRIQGQIKALEEKKEAISDLTSTLQTLRTQAKDFQFGTTFSQFETASTDEDILTAKTSGSNPTTGSFSVEVITLATATVASSSGTLGAAINTAATLNSSGISTNIETGTFSINGVQFNVDPAADSLDGIIASINGSGAGVTATYVGGSDTLTIENTAPGNTSIINFGATDDTSNLLDVLNLEGATQFTNGSGSTEVASSHNLGAANGSDTLNTVNFSGGAVTGGTIVINGVSIVVDPTNESINDVLGTINASDAGVTASLDAATDTIRVVSNTEGSRTISFTAGTSNFLDVTNLTAATQAAGTDTQFRVDGGAIQTSNSNTVTTAISDVSLNLISVGTATVTISDNETAIIADVREFLDAYNKALSELRSLTRDKGALRGDGSIRSIETKLQSTIFQSVAGAGALTTLVEIGITSGDSFSASAGTQYELDEEVFLEALRDDPSGVQKLFSNDADDGVADVLFEFLDSIAGFNGTLAGRSKANGSIDRQIRSMNDRIERIEGRLDQREARLRSQFTRLEQLSAGFQQQGQSLGALGAGFSRF
jgi:flagellar hook-associated protein 2